MTETHPLSLGPLGRLLIALLVAGGFAIGRPTPTRAISPFEGWKIKYPGDAYLFPYYVPLGYFEAGVASAAEYDALPGLVVSSLPPGPPLHYPATQTRIYMRWESHPRRDFIAWSNAMAYGGWCYDDLTGDNTHKCKLDEPYYQPHYGTIRINKNHPLILSYNAQQRYRIVNHEMGHVMGLAHRRPGICLDTVMEQNAIMCQPLVFLLSGSDKNLNSLYPPLP